jgi:hypothetical protein
VNAREYKTHEQQPKNSTLWRIIHRPAATIAPRLSVMAIHHV